MTTLILDTYTPAKHLPAHVTHDGMELLEANLSKCHDNGSLFVEIGNDLESTGLDLSNFLNANFLGVLDQAIEEECEYIHFYI